MEARFLDWKHDFYIGNEIFNLETFLVKKKKNYLALLGHRSLSMWISFKKLLMGKKKLTMLKKISTKKAELHATFFIRLMRSPINL